MRRRIGVTQCPNCGAPVQANAIADPENPVCPFCQASLPVVGDAPTTHVGHPSPPAARGARGGVIAAAVVSLVVVGVVVAAVVGHGVSTGGGGSGGSSADYVVYGNVVPAAGGRQIYLIAPNVDSSDTPVLRRVDVGTGTIVWTSAPITGEGATSALVLAAGSRVLVIAGATVFAYDAASGKSLWEASLSNGLPGGCPGGCAEVIGTDLVTLALDGTVQGIDTGTGRQLWSRHLADTPRYLEAAGGLAAVVSSPSPPADDLLLFSPATGAMRTIAPSCTADGSGDDVATADDPSGFFLSPDGTTVTVLVTGIAGCVTRYRIADGRLLWRSPPDADNVRIPFDLTGESAVGGSTVAWTNEIGHDRWVFDVDLGDGAVRQLFDAGNENGTTTLDGTVAGTLVLETAPSYASEQPAIYGVSLATGRQLWMLASRAPSDGSGSQSVIVTSTGVVVASCDGSDSCKLEAVDPASGLIRGTVTVATSDPIPSIDDLVAAGGEVVGNVAEERAAVVDATTGAKVGIWPAP